MFHLASQIPQKMFCVNVAGNELSTVTHDSCQDGFPISVNRCHFNHPPDESNGSRLAIIWKQFGG